MMEHANPGAGPETNLEAISETNSSQESGDLDDNPGILECRVADVTCDIEFKDPKTPAYYGMFDGHIIKPAGSETHAASNPTSKPAPAPAQIHTTYNARGVRNIITFRPPADAAFAEWQLAYDQVSRQMLRFGRLTFHGACIEYAGRAYVFTAFSGTGKSTHIRLWRRYLGPSVLPVNGDKPIFRLDDGNALACGTPWSGKERWQRNVQVPLGGIAILKRGTTCSIRKATVDEAVEELMNRIYLTRDAEEAMLATDLLDKLIARVPIYVLTCDMSEQAVKTSFEAMTGLDYATAAAAAATETAAAATATATPKTNS
ncbi:hypothetical protein [Bifidobacterium leontopitheci]|uniref:Uncharacterized protein n=1 Tax=Bifidobacterium leontopitheci TaxID=2650774 RepID=A0A6I1GR23_9BIFI|nr:hypothetical protein [Bifidobacterium leontopitheci]KAB7789001.1 hypothetical protein F7D09_2041 [Bifidobacterium leontopitheci]